MSSASASLPSKMRGLVLEKFAKSPEEEKTPYTYREDLPLPKLEPHSVLLKTMTAGYCHTEMMVVRGEFGKMMNKDLPLVPSHEPTGKVVQWGSEVEAMVGRGEAKGLGAGGPLKVGDRIAALATSKPCGKCEECKTDRPIFCSNGLDFCGVTADGALADYIAVDVRSCIRLPDNLDFDTAAPLMCAGATIYTAIKACKLSSGQSLAIIGAGALGHLGVQFSKCLSYKTVLIDSRDPPLEMCRSLKYPPDVTYNSAKVKVQDSASIEEAIKQCGGQVDAVIVTTDAIPAFQFGLELPKKHGLFMVVGQPQDPIPVPFFPLIFRDITIKGSLLSEAPLAKEMCDLVAEKGIECRTKAYDLKDVHKLMSDYALPSHSGKLVVHVNTE